MEILEKHQTQFGQNPIIIRSPGRINLIGGHTDYNMGFALPAAIDKALFLSFSKNSTLSIQVQSLDFDSKIDFSIDEIPSEQEGWQAYLIAAIEELIDRDYIVQGFDALIKGNIPIGAGLSSSAAFCCGLVYGISQLFDFQIPSKEVALIAQATEHRIGLNCGLLDQFAIVFSEENKGLFVDFKTMEVEPCKMDLSDCLFVLFDSKVKHELAAEGGYNDRVKSCNNVVEIVKEKHPTIESLRDVSHSMLLEEKEHISAIDFKRAEYIIGENERVKEAKKALEENNPEKLGALMTATHEGLQHDYEVSTPELDYLIHLAKKNEAIYGGRMIGGGFGGCTLNLVQKEKVEEAITTIKTQYAEKFGIEIPAYVVSPSKGISVVSESPV